MSETMTAVAAARRLGIKVETLYAYVSRGVLHSKRAPGERASRFDRAEVEGLARRGRPRRTSSHPSSFDITIDTSLIEIDGRHLRYRDHDATRLARSHTFEQVTMLLWTGELPDGHQPWVGSVIDTPDMPGLLDRIRTVAAIAGSRDPMRNDLRPPAVAACGQSLLATLVDSLPVAGDGRTPRLELPAGGAALRGTLAGRLWSRLVSHRPAPGMIAALNGALVLLADHELAASTFAARVAASTRADPYAVVATGLGVVTGPYHGGASRLVRQLLRTAAAESPNVALAEALRNYGTYPGFGQALYPEGDPRAVALLALLREAAGGQPDLAVVDAVMRVARLRAPAHPNIDFALGALGHVAKMPDDAGEATFAIARTAGWLAHAIEEYGEAPLRFRPRAQYRPPR